MEASDGRYDNDERRYQRHQYDKHPLDCERCQFEAEWLDYRLRDAKGRRGNAGQRDQAQPQ